MVEEEDSLGGVLAERANDLDTADEAAAPAEAAMSLTSEVPEPQPVVPAAYAADDADVARQEDADADADAVGTGDAAETATDAPSGPGGPAEAVVALQTASAASPSSAAAASSPAAAEAEAEEVVEAPPLAEGVGAEQFPVAEAALAAAAEDVAEAAMAAAADDVADAAEDDIFSFPLAAAAAADQSDAVSRSGLGVSAAGTGQQEESVAFAAHPDGDENVAAEPAAALESDADRAAGSLNSLSGGLRPHGPDHIPLCDLVKQEVEVQLAGALREVHFRLAVLQARGCFGEKVGTSGKPDTASPGLRTPLEHSAEDDLDEEDEEDDEDCEHVVEESIWEAVALVGLPGVGVAGSILMLVGLAVNLLLQVLFILALFLDTLRWWAVLGKFPRHSATAAASLPDTPSEGPTIELPIVEAVTDARPDVPFTLAVKAYLDQSRIASLIGVAFCGCVLFLWFLNIAQEFVEVATFSSALLQLPLAKRTELMWCGYGSVLTSINRWRLAAMLMLMLIRFAIASALLLLGALWFTHTTSMLDLVLNAAVVAFILDLDEQVFLKFVPFRVRLILQDLLPLRTARTSMSWCTPRMVVAGASFLTVVILMPAAFASILPANMTTMPRVAAEL